MEKLYSRKIEEEEDMKEETFFAWVNKPVYVIGRKTNTIASEERIYRTR